MIEDQTRALEGDEAVRQLVLNRLELSDRLPELVTLPGIIGRQLKSPTRRAMRPRRQRQLPLEQEIVEHAIFLRNEGNRH